MPRECNRPLTRRNAVSAVLSNSNVLAYRPHVLGLSVTAPPCVRASPAGWSAAGFGTNRCVPREHLQILRLSRAANPHTAATCHRRRHRPAGGGVAHGSAESFRKRRPTACLRSHALRRDLRHPRATDSVPPCRHNRVGGQRRSASPCVSLDRDSRKGIATETRSRPKQPETRDNGKNKTRPR